MQRLSAAYSAANIDEYLGQQAWTTSVVGVKCWGLGSETQLQGLIAEHPDRSLACFQMMSTSYLIGFGLDVLGMTGVLNSAGLC